MATPKTAPPPRTRPAIDEHVVEVEGRAELLDGELIAMSPADEPHGNKHFWLVYLLGAHLREDFQAAVDMLTRSAEDQDFAPDVSVYPSERDEEGKRRLDELSFEIVGRQPMSVCTRKAELLSERGVRRIFAVDVDENSVFEWNRALSVWSYLEHASFIADPCFVRPLPVAAILDAADADDAVFDALRAKKNAALMDFEQTSFRKGREEGLLLARRQAVADLCEVLSVPLTDERRAALEAADMPALDALTAQLKQLKRWP